jgi:hypothetical protein
LERLYQCCVVVAAVVNAGNMDTFRQLAGATGARNCGHDMLAGLEQCFCHMLSHMAAGLFPS